MGVWWMWWNVWCANIPPSFISFHSIPPPSNFKKKKRVPCRRTFQSPPDSSTFLPSFRHVYTTLIPQFPPSEKKYSGFAFCVCVCVCVCLHLHFHFHLHLHTYQHLNASRYKYVIKSQWAMAGLDRRVKSGV